MSDQLKVLIVEDEMLLRMRAVDMVEDAGFSAVEAVNADQALAIAARPEVVFCTFGDMLRVPGSHKNLWTAKAEGADVVGAEVEPDAGAGAESIAALGKQRDFGAQHPRLAPGRVGDENAAARNVADTHEGTA